MHIRMLPSAANDPKIFPILEDDVVSCSIEGDCGNTSCQHICRIEFNDGTDRIISLNQGQLGALKGLPKEKIQSVSRCFWDNRLTEQTSPSDTNILPNPLPELLGRIKHFGNYAKIALTSAEKTRNFVCNFFSLWIFRSWQNYRLNRALERGDIKTAKSALHWGASLSLSLGAKKLTKLIAEKNSEALKFLISQIHFDKEAKTVSPKEGWNVVRLRDWSYDGNVCNLNLNLLSQLLTKEEFPRNYLYFLHPFFSGNLFKYFHSFDPDLGNGGPDVRYNLEATLGKCFSNVPSNAIFRLVK